MLKITTSETRAPYWCSLPNAQGAKLDGASYDTLEDAVAAAEKRSEPLIGIFGTRTTMGVPHAHCTRVIER